MSIYTSVRISEIEAQMRKIPDTHYVTIPRHEVKWLIDTLRVKMAECEHQRLELGHKV